MIQARAEQLAIDFIVKETGRELKVIGSRNWPKRPDEWNVLFETVDLYGNVADGPTIVIVNARTESVRFFEGK
jgi:hypothetical protein